MTPEDTMAAADLMRRYAESVQAGKPIVVQISRWDRDKWIEQKNCTPAWDWQLWQYRERPEPPKPQYRAYATVEEVLVGAVVRTRDGGRRAAISGVWTDSERELRIAIGGCSSSCTARGFFHNWVIDATGEPAGVKVEPKQEEGR